VTGSFKRETPAEDTACSHAPLHLLTTGAGEIKLDFTGPI